ncbi:MAG: hypothetical protein LBT01_01720 [Spirochaetaceae bacterium]|nr:hypothetical protein [Spirochaetaceae bacterium]
MSLMQKITVFLFSWLVLSSCGLDSYMYLEPVTESSVVRTSNYGVSFTLDDYSSVSLNFQTSNIPSINGQDMSYFHSHYYLFYKIYVSGFTELSPSETTYASINPTLGSDYTSLKPYTVVTNNYASSVASAFSSRKFFRIDNASNPLILRSRDLITPYPTAENNGRYFFYSADLINPNYLNANNNADVTANSTAGGDTLAYTAIYVAQRAFDPLSLTEIYSIPTFLGVFLLPNNFNFLTVNFNNLSIAALNSASPPPYTARATITLGSAESGLLDITNISVEDVSGVGMPITMTSLTQAGGVYTLDLSNEWVDFSGDQIKITLNRSGYNFIPSSLIATVP